MIMLLFLFVHLQAPRKIKILGDEPLREYITCVMSGSGKSVLLLPVGPLKGLISSEEEI